MSAAIETGCQVARPKKRGGSQLVVRKETGEIRRRGVRRGKPCPPDSRDSNGKRQNGRRDRMRAVETSRAPFPVTPVLRNFSVHRFWTARLAKCRHRPQFRSAVCQSDISAGPTFETLTTPNSLLPLMLRRVAKFDAEWHEDCSIGSAQYGRQLAQESPLKSSHPTGGRLP